MTTFKKWSFETGDTVIENRPQPTCGSNIHLVWFFGPTTDTLQRQKLEVYIVVFPSYYEFCSQPSQWSRWNILLHFLRERGNRKGGRRENSMDFLSARRKKRVIMTPICGRQSWLIVNSEVNWVEKILLILEMFLTFLFEMRKWILQCWYPTFFPRYQQWCVAAIYYLVNYVKIILLPRLFGIVHICFIML